MSSKPRVSGLDSTTLRLVRLGRTVTKDGIITGLVIKTYGPRCWVKWNGNVYAECELCKDVTVL